MTPTDLAIIAGMALATWMTRISGLFASYDASHTSGFAERFMKNLPAALLAALIGPKLARMLIQVRVVVRTTSAIEMPSTPSLYWMPKVGTQSATSPNWKPD